MRLIQIFLKTCCFIFLNSCERDNIDLHGYYRCIQQIDKKSDSCFLEITKDSSLIYINYENDSGMQFIYIAIKKLRYVDDTIYASMDSQMDSLHILYCEKVDKYAQAHNLYNNEVNIACTLMSELSILRFSDRKIEMNNSVFKKVK